MRWALLQTTLWLALSLGCLARPVEIRFSTLPPDCAIADLDAPDRPNSVGSILVEPPAPGQALRFRLFKPGYNSLAVEIPASALGRGSKVVWPAESGSFLRLEPLLVTATFYSSPSGAQIWSSRVGQSDDYLGVTGQPILLNLAELMSGDKEDVLRVRLVAPGYQSVEVPIPQHLFGPGRPNRWPAEGEYALAPSSGMWALLVFNLRLRPWTSALVGLVLVSLAVLLLRLAARGWSVVMRARSIEQRVASPGQDLAGARLGPYRLLDVLGRGATATVFRGVIDESSDKAGELAIKVFNLGSDGSERLAREVKPLLELRHPNLVSLLDWGQVDRFAYLVTEMVPGRTLRQELEHGPMHLERWRILAADLLSGLAHAHSRGVIHGDIKPENLILPWHGKAKLVDFGLARRTLHQGLERFGGTPGYMAPELSSLSQANERTDQFAAGTLLFEALFGVFPGAPAWDAGARAPLAEVLLRMRHSDPAQRYDDLEEAMQAIQAARVRE
jgi:hypothetical protein